MSKLFFLILIFIGCLLLSKTKAQVALSEIMYDVPGSDAHDEFIELYNISETDSVDLTGWALSDSSGIDYITDTGEGLILEPKQFAVILDGSYQANSQTYEQLIPENALRLKIDDNEFVDGALTNTKAKTVQLIDSSGKTVQAYRYTTDNEAGYSDEKIILSQDNSDENWGNSIHFMGTPGYFNSISPFSDDIGFGEEGIVILPSVGIKVFQKIQFTLTLTNFGYETYNDSAFIKFYMDINQDSVITGADSLIILFSDYLNLEPDGKATYDFSWTPVISGRFQFLAAITSESDLNELNNQRVQIIDVIDIADCIRINEIKFLTQAGEPEWIELINTGNSALSLQSWSVADLRDTARINMPFQMNPGDLVIVAADTGLNRFYEIDESKCLVLPKFPNLNNDEDNICLINPAGGWVDQVPYNVSWLEGEEWREPSLEKININLDSRNPASWGPSLSGNNSTPGGINSVYAESKPKTTQISIEPNPFSPDGDAFENHTMINIKAPVQSGRIKAEIYDILGRKIRQLSADSYTSSDINLIWNGRDDHGQIVRMGLYILWIQVLDDRNGVLIEAKETIAVAKR
ncbi:MAG: lamin tail domain-containing protein [Calditrichaceae bacterium]|nr:lamin tail domain-containing protein [Calditrichaceae bacterium]MBN2708244.1 lamin tail domain-containing protein [Calditrichaceae bacterium]RQV92266.1 MAG: lamin tail domain-containing protein [Calditrichota bacterium]